MLYKTAASSIEKKAFIGTIGRFALKAAPKLEQLGGKIMSTTEKGFNKVKNFPVTNKITGAAKNTFNKFDNFAKQNGYNLDYKKIGVGTLGVAAGTYGAYRIGKAMFGNNNQQQPQMQPQY